MSNLDPRFRLTDLVRGATRDQSATTPLSDEEFISLSQRPVLPAAEVAHWTTQLLSNRALRDQWTRLMKAGQVSGIAWLSWEEGLDNAEERGDVEGEMERSMPPAPSAVSDERQSPRVRPPQAIQRAVIRRAVPGELERRTWGRLLWPLTAAALAVTSIVLWMNRPRDPGAQLAECQRLLDARQYASSLQHVQLLIQSSTGETAGEARSIAEAASYELLRQARRDGNKDAAEKLLVQAQGGDFASARLFLEALQTLGGLRTSDAFAEQMLLDSFSRRSPDEALQAQWEDAVATYSNDNQLRLNYVHWLLRHGRLVAAVRQLDNMADSEAVEFAAGIARTLVAESVASGDHAEEFRAALTSFQKVLETRPEHVGALYNAAVLCLKLDEPTQARDYLQRARQAAEADPEMLRRIDDRMKKLPR